MIHILIVDDHEIIHRGLKELLLSETEYQIKEHAYSGLEAIEKSRKIKPDIIFMDISMPDMNGIEATKVIKQESPKSKIIILTQHDEPEYVFQALKEGASGYILKNTSTEQLVYAMQEVLADKRFLNEEITQKFLSATLTEREKLKSSISGIYLTKREKEILKLISEDFNNNQIADKLSLSLRTIETHRRNIMQKFKVNTVVGLLKAAAKNNLIS